MNPFSTIEPHFYLEWNWVYKKAQSSISFKVMVPTRNTGGLKVEIDFKWFRRYTTALTISIIIQETSDWGQTLPPSPPPNRICSHNRLEFNYQLQSKSYKKIFQKKLAYLRIHNQVIRSVEKALKSICYRQFNSIYYILIASFRPNKVQHDNINSNVHNKHSLIVSRK